MRKLLVLLICLNFLTGHSSVIQKPQKETWLVDKASFLSEEQQSFLLKNLNSFYEQKGFPVLLVTIDSLDGIAIEEYANKLFNSWGFANAKDQGVLLLISRKDRQLRIETGYGSEEKLPDIWCAKIIKDEIVPRFKSEQHFQGILNGLFAITTLMEPNFVWDTQGTEEMELSRFDTTIFFFPEKVSYVWNPQHLVSDDLVNNLTTFIQENTPEDRRFYIAFLKSEHEPDNEYLNKIYYEYSNNIFIAFDRDSKFHSVLLIFPQHEIKTDIYTFGGFFNRFDKFLNKNKGIKKAKLDSISEKLTWAIENKDYEKGIREFITAHTLLLEDYGEFYKLKEKMPLYIFISIFGFFAILMFVLFIVKGGSGGGSNYSYSSTLSKDDDRDDNSNNFFSSSSSSDSNDDNNDSSFGGGSSGGGGASGSW